MHKTRAHVRIIYFSQTNFWFDFQLHHTRTHSLQSWNTFTPSGKKRQKTFNILAHYNTTTTKTVVHSKPRWLAMMEKQSKIFSLFFSQPRQIDFIELFTTAENPLNHPRYMYGCTKQTNIERKNKIFVFSFHYAVCTMRWQIKHTKKSKRENFFRLLHITSWEHIYVQLVSLVWFALGALHFYSMRVRGRKFFLLRFSSFLRTFFPLL